MKLFKTIEIQIISLCQELFNVECRVFSWNAVVKKFVNKFYAWCSI